MILLVTLNATYQHAAFGLRYIHANMKELRDRTRILELTTALSAKDIAEKILARKPAIVGFGVYIWNTRATEDVVRVLKKVAPEIRIVLGGPEVSYEAEKQTLCEAADNVIQGEADVLFYEYCRDVLAGAPPEKKFIKGALPDLKTIETPYALYTDEDIKNRFIYVEASRGCPYKCEYCLSSLDVSVRNFPLEPFLADLDSLIRRGARSFKFVDRTFNLSPTISGAILEFFLARIELGLFLHFEMVPDRLPEALREQIKKFPAGSLQFEIGIQTFNPEVAKNVSRRQDYLKIAENLKYLKAETGVHTHADLIVGLPGETLESFGQGFETLLELAPDEIQVGILKRLKGTPIVRHDREFQMVYDESPPFQILRNRDFTFNDLQRMIRFARYWDALGNSGRFPRWMDATRAHAAETGRGFFREFLELSDHLGEQATSAHNPQLSTLAKQVAAHCRDEWNWDEEKIAETLGEDYRRAGKTDSPEWLKAPKRQRRHLVAGAATLPS